MILDHGSTFWTNHWRIQFTGNIWPWTTSVQTDSHLVMNQIDPIRLYDTISTHFFIMQQLYYYRNSRHLQNVKKITGRCMESLLHERQHFPLTKSCNQSILLNYGFSMWQKNWTWKWANIHIGSLTCVLIALPQVVELVGFCIFSLAREQISQVLVPSMWL